MSAVCFNFYGQKKTSYICFTEMKEKISINYQNQKNEVVKNGHKIRIKIQITAIHSSNLVKALNVCVKLKTELLFC